MFVMWCLRPPSLQVLLVGGFAASPYLQQRVKEELGGVLAADPRPTHTEAAAAALAGQSAKLLFAIKTRVLIPAQPAAAVVVGKQGALGGQGRAKGVAGQQTRPCQVSMRQLWPAVVHLQELCGSGSSPSASAPAVAASAMASRRMCPGRKTTRHTAKATATRKRSLRTGHSALVRTPVRTATSRHACRHCRLLFTPIGDVLAGRVQYGMCTRVCLWAGCTVLCTVFFPARCPGNVFKQYVQRGQLVQIDDVVTHKFSPLNK